jgi:hypothetical protein
MFYLKNIFDSQLIHGMKMDDEHEVEVDLLYRMLHKFFTKNKCLGSVVITFFHITRISKTKFEVRGVMLGV